MSDLRDARFRKALEHAPDADVGPGDAARQQILSRARDAVREARPAPWWRAIWASPGQRMPWNAALATIAIASLITVLWHDEKVPDARPEAAVTGESQPVRAASSPPGAAPPASALVIAASAPAERARVATSAPRVTARIPASAQTPPRSEPAAAAADTVAAKPERRADAASVAGVLRESAPTELAKAAPQPSQTAAAAAPAVPMVAAPAARMATQFAPSPVDGATQLHVRAAGRTIDVPLARPSRIADLLQRLAREPRTAEALEQGVDMLIELREGGELVAMLELAGDQARWTILRSQDGTSGTVREPAGAAVQLSGELTRLLRR